MCMFRLDRFKLLSACEITESLFLRTPGSAIASLLARDIHIASAISQHQSVSFTRISCAHRIIYIGRLWEVVLHNKQLWRQVHWCFCEEGDVVKHLIGGHFALHWKNMQPPLRDAMFPTTGSHVDKPPVHIIQLPSVYLMELSLLRLSTYRLCHVSSLLQLVLRVFSASLASPQRDFEHQKSFLEPI